MNGTTVSERLFAEFCEAAGVPYSRLEPGVAPRPDFLITLGGVEVFAEVKQLDPNEADLDELRELALQGGAGRYVPHRLRSKLKGISPQLKVAAQGGHPTLLVVYDNTPFKMYCDHLDVVQTLFGRYSVTVSVPVEPGLPTHASQPFFGPDRGVGPGRNTSMSALAVLDGGPTTATGLRVYHNPYAVVCLDPALFDGLPVSQPVLPGAIEVHP